jgi:hypothetical protein
MGSIAAPWSPSTTPLLDRFPIPRRIGRAPIGFSISRTEAKAPPPQLPLPLEPMLALLQTLPHLEQMAPLPQTLPSDQALDDLPTTPFYYLHPAYDRLHRGSRFTINEYILGLPLFGQALLPLCPN